MTREEIFNGVQNIFRDIFDDEKLIIEDRMTAEDIEDWDSFNHINLVSVIEKEYEISFALGELQALKSVEALIDLVVKKQLN